MACNKEFAEKVHKYLDEDVTLLEKKQLESHIIKCEKCEKQLRDLKKTIAIIQSASHMEAPNNFTANVMSQLPKQSYKNKWKTWMRRHPFVLTAAVFFLMFVISVHSVWTEGNKEIIVKGDGHFIVDEQRRVVVIPEGQTISGDLVVKNGNVEVNGEVLGNITVIKGEQYLASAGHVAGEIQEINQVLEWLWFQTKSFFSDVISFIDSNDDKSIND
ncbi:anti-sigma factor [Evansella sp. AB-rgal1]|uniref:anti-sigma factor n=1 Tax=Evansella sp. AB-rgal1 TaxID=3242696 RepID=UPI00359E8C04